MEEILKALEGKEVESSEELESGLIKISFTDGSFIVVGSLMTTSEELGIEVSEDEPEEKPKEEASDNSGEIDASEDMETVSDILDVEADEEEIVEAINKAKKKVLTKIIKALDLDADDFDDADEMREGILEELDIDSSDWDD